MTNELLGIELSTETKSQVDVSGAANCPASGLTYVDVDAVANGDADGSTSSCEGPICDASAVASGPWTDVYECYYFVVGATSFETEGIETYDSPVTCVGG